MKQPDFILRNEKGSTLIVALMILVLLTLIGIAATNTSTTEIQIAGNDKAYKQAFYNADGGVSWVVATSPSTSGITPNPNPTESSKISVPNGAPFEVFYLSKITDGPPKEIEIQSDSVGGHGRASVVAGVRLPPSAGGIPGQGLQGGY